MFELEILPSNMAILLGFPGMSLENLDLELLHFGTLKYIYMYVCYVNGNVQQREDLTREFSANISELQRFPHFS